MHHKITFLLTLIFPLALASCSSVEPLDGTSASVSKPSPAVQTDQTVLASKVGEAEPGVTPLAWANPATGSAGVIEKIDGKADGSSCRSFVSTAQTLDGVKEVSGLACPTNDSSWKLAGQ